jgi:hypothetical protein
MEPALRDRFAICEPLSGLAFTANAQAARRRRGGAHAKAIPNTANYAAQQCAQDACWRRGAFAAISQRARTGQEKVSDRHRRAATDQSVFSGLRKPPSTQQRKHGLHVMTAEANTAGDSAAGHRDRERDQPRRQGHHPRSSNATALVPIVKKARDAGIVVVTTNTSLAPMTAADAAYGPTTCRRASSLANGPRRPWARNRAYRDARL